jgi:preprotein translocase subunit SecA
MLFDTCDDIVLNHKGTNDYDGFKLTLLSTLQIDLPISKEDFAAIEEQELTDKTYDLALKHYHRKNKTITEKSLPILRDIQKTRGATVKNILVPFSDGKKQIGVSADLELSVKTEGGELIKSMEKMIVLAIIDNLWKEHLREMDDLKQSVQNAVYEQKDPLLIYKFEGFNLFKLFIAKLNEDTISFLMKAEIPVQEPDQVQEARSQRRQKLHEQKDESRSALSDGRQAHDPSRAAQKVEPAKTQKIASRNARVTVQYSNGSVKKDVKFKVVEEDVRQGNCVIIED